MNANDKEDCMNLLAQQKRVGCQSATDLANGWTSAILDSDEYQFDVPEANRLEVPVQDLISVDILEHMPAACRFIAAARASGGAVLVHCVAGVSRSVTVSPADYSSCIVLIDRPKMSLLSIFFF